jgi:predicted nucleic acid-binding protein
MCITFVTVGELMKWRVLRSWGPSRTDELARWRQDVGVLAYDEAAADKWGQLQAGVQRRGRPRPQNDAWIAACCPVDDLPLATLNIKDFTDFAEHEGLTLISSQSPDRYARLPPVSTWSRVHPCDSGFC